MKKSLVSAIAGLALCAAPAFAQTAHPAAQSHKPAAMSADARFVQSAARGGMAEVELGKLAAERASNEDVKKFGQRMVEDHGKANDDLKTIASKENVTWPDKLDAKHQTTYNRLSKLSGHAFDRAYMQAMLQDHRADVTEFKTRARMAKDPDVKEFASKHLPTLEEHLKMAQTTNGAVATSGTTHPGTKGTSGATHK